MLANIHMSMDDLVQVVRFSQSFDEEEGAGEEQLQRAGSKPPLAPSGGSVSLAAQHFCPVCGIIATSQDNLEVPPSCSRICRCLHYPCCILKAGPCKLPYLRYVNPACSISIQPICLLDNNCCCAAPASLLHKEGQRSEVL